MPLGYISNTGDVRELGPGGRGGWTTRRARRVAELGQERTAGGSSWLATVAGGTGGGERKQGREGD